MLEGIGDVMEVWKITFTNDDECGNINLVQLLGGGYLQADLRV